MAEQYLSTLSNMITNYADVTGTTVQTGSPYIAASTQEYMNLLSWAGLHRTLTYNQLPPTEQQKIEAVITMERNNTSGSSGKKGC